MGICMRLYLAPDPDLRAFAVAPAALKAWLRFPRGLPEVSLQEYWRDLDTLLAATPAADTESLLTANGADWIFPEAGDLGAYGLSSTSMQVLRKAVEQVQRSQVEAYVRMQWSRWSQETGGPPQPTAMQLSAATEEVLLYLGRLQGACALAAAKGYGTVMVLWEEP
jgi:hypothetical protein